jgi:penicillin-binding protein 1C
LGNAEARLIDLTNAYAALARMGEFRPWRVFTDDAPRSGRLVGDPRACWLIADILSDNAARVPSFGIESALRFEFPVACKTGTSTDYRDNWALGYTPEFTVGVWTGNFNGTAMQNVSGVTGAAP